MREMKDSGVEWIGEIPKEWQIAPLKQLTTLITDGTHQTPNYIDEGIPFLSIKDVSSGKFNFSDVKYISEEEHQLLSKHAPVEQGDIIFTRIGTLGVALVVDCETIFDIFVSLGLIKTKSELVNNKWLVYNMNSPHYFNYIQLVKAGGGTSAAKYNLGDVGSSYVILPNMSEQSRLVNYLDAKCNQLDSIIEKQQTIIEKLKEYKLSIITETVTKGLNPDAEMKDSGVEWIGKIPKEWTVGKTLYALSMPITDGPHETPELFDDGIPFVSAEAVSCGNGKIDFDHIRGYISHDFYEECCKKYVPQINDIYMIKSGATTGKVAIVDTDKIFTIWSPLGVFRCNPEKMYFMYLYYFLQSDTYQKQVQDKWTFGTQQNIGMRSLEKLMICFPSVEEQKEISDYICMQCQVIEKNISTKQLVVEKLQEYKKSLIYEVVTGKKEV